MTPGQLPDIAFAPSQFDALAINRVGISLVDFPVLLCKYPGGGTDNVQGKISAYVDLSDVRSRAVPI